MGLGIAPLSPLTTVQGVGCLFFFFKDNHIVPSSGGLVLAVFMYHSAPFPRLAAVPGSPQCPVRVWEAAAHMSPIWVQAHLWGSH